ncbi:MAG: methylated-DNA--[protein]-cysteine S-methyltransferase [Acidimicrobiia bacterium]|nr:methylated-DNA--[protein]-cysteine S-methyltransferase [Acidimicrobiia bacterium]
MLHARIYETPVGELSIIADPSTGTVSAAGFCPPQDLIDRLPGEPAWMVVKRLPLTDRAVADYFKGNISALDDIPVHQRGTELQHEIWSGLRSIPGGSTATYSELAATTSKPRAVRAAGTACGRNLVAPIVPCHRALRSDGSLGGYYYGLDVKRWLLDHEAANAL